MLDKIMNLLERSVTALERRNEINREHNANFAKHLDMHESKTMGRKEEKPMEKPMEKPTPQEDDSANGGLTRDECHKFLTDKGVEYKKRLSTQNLQKLVGDYMVNPPTPEPVVAGDDDVPTEPAVEDLMNRSVIEDITAEKVDKEQLREDFVSLSKEKGTDHCRDLLAKVGCSKFSDIKEEDLGKFQELVNPTVEAEIVEEDDDILG